MNGLAPFNDTRVAFHVGSLNETIKMFAADLEALPPPENATDPSENLRGQVTFAHFATRTFSTTAGVLEAMEEKLATGAFLVFDDMLNYPNYEEGELKALYESLLRTGKSIEVIGFEGPILNESPQELERLSFNHGTPLTENVLFRLA